MIVRSGFTLFAGKFFVVSFDFNQLSAELNEFGFFGATNVPISGDVLYLEFEVLVFVFVGDLWVAFSFDFIDLCVPNFQSMYPYEVLCELLQECGILLFLFFFAFKLAQTWSFTTSSILFRFGPSIFLLEIML